MTTKSSGTNDADIDSEPKAHGWTKTRGFKPQGVHGHAFESTNHEPSTSLSASFSEEESMNMRHIPTPLATYQIRTRNEKSEHVGFASGLNAGRAPRKVSPGPIDTDPSIPRP